jgi:tRNA(adenine34) deaminase
MRQALIQAQIGAAHGEVPVGAVMVRNGDILASGYNQVESMHDPTAHAEMLCIRASAERLGEARKSYFSG